VVVVESGSSIIICDDVVSGWESESDESTVIVGGGGVYVEGIGALEELEGAELRIVVVSLSATTYQY
jgi:hypothetical protein